MKILIFTLGLILSQLASAYPKPADLTSWACIVNGSGRMQVLKATNAEWAREFAARNQTKAFAEWGGDENGQTRPVATEQVACMALYGVDAEALKTTLGDQFFKNSSY